MRSCDTQYTKKIIHYAKKKTRTQEDKNQLIRIIEKRIHLNIFDKNPFFVFGSLS
jgi:hypothetical protein